MTLVTLPKKCLIIIASGSLLVACSRTPESARLARQTQTTADNVFDKYLEIGIAPADGFDFPVGGSEAKEPYRDNVTGKQYSGWYIATRFADIYSYGIHTGEDWSGGGPPASDLGQDVHSVATGKVAFADFCGRLWGNVVMIDHIFYENYEKKSIRSVYAHLHEIKTHQGDVVPKGGVIGSVGQDPEKLFAPHLHLELRWDESLSPTYWPSSNGKDVAWVKEHYTDPSTFIRDHRALPQPQREQSLILVDQKTYKMRLYKSGQLHAEYDVSFGQAEGPKRFEGDNKTPTGMYFVIQKHEGNFDGPYGAYYGGYWIKVNYPNEFDASRARIENQLSASQQAFITKAWRQRKQTLENTKIGGGIGFHGWIRDWSNDGPRRLSWGCVVMHPSDISKLYDQIPEGTMVVIF